MDSVVRCERWELLWGECSRLRVRGVERLMVGKRGCDDGGVGSSRVGGGWVCGGWRYLCRVSVREVDRRLGCGIWWERVFGLG